MTDCLLCKEVCPECGGPVGAKAGSLDWVLCSMCHATFNHEHATVHLLADRPDLIEAVAMIRFREWGHPPEETDPQWWIEITRKEAGRTGLPLTWVAVDVDGDAVGAVGLGEFDIEERRDRSPWVLGMVVEPDHRSMGIGAMLMAKLEATVAELGYDRCWVATGQARAFYERIGWEWTETVEREVWGPHHVLTKGVR